MRETINTEQVSFNQGVFIQNCKLEKYDILLKMYATILNEKQVKNFSKKVNSVGKRTDIF